MRILLCSATETEIGPVAEMIKTSGKAEVLITGVGLISATYAITHAVCSNRPALILQAGIAGYLDPALRPGMVVAIGMEYIADQGVQEDVFRSVFDLGLEKENRFPFSRGGLPNNHRILQQCGLPVVNGITVNEVSTNSERISLYRKNFSAGTESMEGAALHYVGLSEGIPFLQVRSLSNHIGERDKSKWETGRAVHELNRWIEEFILKSRL